MSLVDSFGPLGDDHVAGSVPGKIDHRQRCIRVDAECGEEGEGECAEPEE